MPEGKATGHNGYLFIVALIVLSEIFFSPLYVYAQPPITIGPAQVENQFPQYFALHFPVRSTAGDIVDVRGRVRFGIRPVYQRVSLDLTPGRETTATWVWDTSRITVPPYIPIEFQLEVKDAQGNRLKTDSYLFIYEDNRFAWRERRSQHLLVRWHEGSDAFGDFIFDIAQDALQRQMDVLDLVPERPLVLVVYANDEDFFAWHSYRTEWIGGQAFPEFGVAAQIIPPNSEPDWLYDVIPHELNHLLVGPYMNTPLGRVPAWFEEGLAQYFEQSPAFEEHYRIQQTVKEGRVLPLGVMRSPPGQDPDEVRLWYAQALSMVEWLIERHGKPALRAFIRELHKGMPVSKAFGEAFGETEEEFYASWRVHMGLPVSTPTATPPPIPTPTLPPTARKNRIPEEVTIPTVMRGPVGGRVVTRVVAGGDSNLTTRNPPTTTPTPYPTSPEITCTIFGLALSLVFVGLVVASRHV